MEDDKLHVIASESKEVCAERVALKHRLAALEAGKRVLNEHIGMEFLRLRSSQISDYLLASNPAKYTKESSSTGLRPVMRPHTPVSQHDHYGDHAKAATTAELTSRFGGLVITPPPSRRTSPGRSRDRVDSVTGTPKPCEHAKRLSSPWLPRPDLPTASVEDETDDEY
jgi:hypothetical protein